MDPKGPPPNYWGTGIGRPLLIFGSLMAGVYLSHSTGHLGQIAVLAIIGFLVLASVVRKAVLKRRARKATADPRDSTGS